MDSSQSPTNVVSQPQAEEHERHRRLRLAVGWLHVLSCLSILAGLLLHHELRVPFILVPLGFLGLGCTAIMRMIHSLRFQLGFGPPGQINNNDNPTKQYVPTIVAGVVHHVSFALAAVMFAIGFSLCGNFFGFLGDSENSAVFSHSPGRPFFWTACALWVLSAAASWLLCKICISILYTITALLFLRITQKMIELQGSCCEGFQSLVILGPMLLFVLAIIFIIILGVLNLRDGQMYSRRGQSCCFKRPTPLQESSSPETFATDVAQSLPFGGERLYSAVDIEAPH